MADNADPAAFEQPKTGHGATQVLLSILDRLEQSASATPIEPQPEANTQEEQADKGPTATLGDLVDALDERAFGLLILILALPCCLPFVYILPQIVALPILFLADNSPWAKPPHG